MNRGDVLEEIVREIERKLEWPCIVKCIAITKGFSHEEKYKIELENRETYFVKVCDSANYERKLEEYTYMKQIELLHIPTPKLIHFIKLEELNKCVQVFEWIDGVNGEESLRKLSVEEQYDVGRKAGEVLRRIHSIERESASNKWETFRWNKYERYIEALADYEVNFLDLKPVLTFVENHKDLLKNRPITFLHDDFHPANSMIHNKEFIVIDFGGYDFGDPIHDFYNVAIFTTRISKPFAVGQVHGYCGGEPSLHFWRLYSLYASNDIPG